MKCWHFLAIVVQFAKAVPLSENSKEEANDVDHDLLIKPCLDELVANLIHHQDANGQVLYEARETFELAPGIFQTVVGRAKKDLLDHQNEADQSLFFGSRDSSASWPFLNGLGNLLFWNKFSIPSQYIYSNPILTRKR